MNLDQPVALVLIVGAIIATALWIAHEIRTAPLVDPVAEQAAWDQHVAEAVDLAETALAERLAGDLDTEWADITTNGWVAS